VSEQASAEETTGSHPSVRARAGLIVCVVVSVVALVVGLVENKASLQDRIHRTWPWTGSACKPWSIAWLAAWLLVSGAALGLSVLVVRSRQGQAAPRLRERIAVGLGAAALLFWLVNAVGSELSYCVAWAGPIR
jgi:hypothetical protein